MQKEDIRFEDSVVFEGMTSIRAILRATEDGTNDRKILRILYDKERLSKIGRDVGYLTHVGETLGFPVVESNKTEIDALSVGTSHGGLIALCSDRTLPFLGADVPLPERGFFAMIDGIEDPYNFGYALRSLYACGCTGIVLPERNWFTAAGVVARSSAGASERFRVYQTASASDAIDFFRAHGYTSVCAEEKTENVLGHVDLPLPLLLVVGGEKRGISKDALAKADIKVKIPYARDFAASLSAASATTIFAYEIARQNF